MGTVKPKMVEFVPSAPSAAVLPSDDLMDIPPRYVACRSLKHAWEPSAKVVGEVPVGLRPLGLLCLRCSMERIDGVNNWGQVKYRRYNPPEGYYRTKGQPTIYSTEYRLRLLQLGLEEITMKGKRNAR